MSRTAKRVVVVMILSVLGCGLEEEDQAPDMAWPVDAAVASSEGFVEASEREWILPVVLESMSTLAYPAKCGVADLGGVCFNASNAAFCRTCRQGACLSHNNIQLNGVGVCGLCTHPVTGLYSSQCPHPWREPGRDELKPCFGGDSWTGGVYCRKCNCQPADPDGPGPLPAPPLSCSPDQHDPRGRPTDEHGHCQPNDDEGTGYEP